MRRLLAIVLTICANVCMSGLCANVSNLDNVSFSIISPVDNSLWIATRGRGIVRIGGSGKCFVYSASKGDFPCDSIAALAFDVDGRLWMKDEGGRFFDYSSLSGFVQRSSVPDGMFVVPEESVATPVAEPAGDRTPLLPWIIAVVSVVLLAGYIFVSSHKKSAVKTEPAITAHKSKLVLKPTSKPVEEGFVSNSNVSFYNTVMSLIQENLSNPDFSVEDIADVTGLSMEEIERI